MIGRYMAYRRKPSSRVRVAALSVVLVWLGVAFLGFPWWAALIYTLALPWIVMRMIRG
jgi:apolipoprotein N-acyltransferase